MVSRPIPHTVAVRQGRRLELAFINHLPYRAAFGMDPHTYGSRATPKSQAGPHPRIQVLAPT